jgi:hypothetical protein
MLVWKSRREGAGEVEEVMAIEAWEDELILLSGFAPPLLRAEWGLDVEKSDFEVHGLRDIELREFVRMFEACDS